MADRQQYRSSSGNSRKRRGATKPTHQPGARCLAPPHSGTASYYGHFANPGYPHNMEHPHYYNMLPQPRPPYGAQPHLLHRYSTPLAPPFNRPQSSSSDDPCSSLTAGVSHITLSQEQFKELIRDKAKKQTKSGKQRASTKTVWYSHLKGNVDTPEICIFSIANACKFNDSGCKALHAKCPQHWQFRKGDSWYNFREFHSKELEKAFQRVECDGTELSKLDLNKLRGDKSFAELETLMGDKTWTADFDKMVIKNINEYLEIRRISTRSFVLSQSKMATVYEWYFKDEKDNWIMYGNPNTANDVNCIPNITSDEIEAHFTKEKLPTCEFKSNHHEYVIDFSEMRQTNKKTNTSRPIRRRTKVRPMKSSLGASQTDGSNAVPSYWASMANTAIYELFLLQPSDQEFQKNKKIIHQTLTHCNILKMQRIQNLYLWNAYENKKKFIEKKGKSSNLNERYLFHGTVASNVSSICEQNLDWRLHGSNGGQRFGRGSYFSSSANYSDQYSRAALDGSKAIFIVKVIVGTSTLGDAHMTRPPLNRATGNLYDSTVNDVTNPTIFVKYDNQEYYPEYIVYYK